MNLPTLEPAPATLARRALPWLVIAVIWLLNANYLGLEHDAVLYTFQALAHRSPELYSSDFFLRFGSQDRFTLFTPGYALLIGWFGVEPGAMFTTLLTQAALLYAAWRLARRLFSPTLALAGLALLLALPNDYGPRRIFNVIENFATPRMLAEALVIFALLAILARRRALAVALLIAGALMHPLMAAPGFLLVALLWLPPGSRRVMYGLLLAGLAAVAALGALPLFDGWRVDPQWRAAIDLHVNYLFLQNWAAMDWARVATSLFTLILAVRFLPEGHARQLSLVTLVTAMAGVALALIGADWLRLAIIVQCQPYRFLWPASLLAPLLLPALALALWTRNPAGRATVLALGAAWVMRLEPVAPAMLTATAILAVLAWRGVGNTRAGRWLPAIGALMLAVAVCYSLANSILTNAVVYEDGFAPPAVNRMRSLCVDGLIPVLLIMAVFWLRASSQRLLATGGAVALAAAALLMLPLTAHAWRHHLYDDELVAQFGEWRALIPPRSDVAWIEAPMNNWILLQRPSYFSGHQTGSVVFSRAAAIEALVREREMVPFILGTGLGYQGNRGVLKLVGTHPTVAHSLAEACAATRVKYLVSRAELNAAPLASAPRGVPIGYRGLRLYRCDVSGSAQ